VRAARESRLKSGEIFSVTGEPDEICFILKNLGSQLIAARESRRIAPLERRALRARRSGFFISIQRSSFVKLILLGAPGAGKGTVAKMLTQLDGSVQISTGDILRGAVAAGTELGKKAKAFMDAGDLVPDDLIMGIMEERLQEPDCEKGFLLDGFPRTIPQAEALKELLARLGIELDMAVNLDVPRDVILDRLTTRRTCTGCGAIYNVKSKPPKVEGVCDECGAAVVQRDDETEEAISNRLDVYNEKTAPLVDYYEKEGKLVHVNATSSDVVVQTIKDKLAG
jgi:adenylate kinase